MLRRTAFALLVACSPPSSPPSPTVGTPQFAPDHSELVFQPWVAPVTDAQAAVAEVAPASLSFPRTGNDDVLAWQTGRVITGDPSFVVGSKNPFGFARVVKSVTEVNGKVVVETEEARLEDLFTGGFAVTVRPDATAEPDLSGVDLADVAKRYYQDVDILTLPGSPLRDDSPDTAGPYAALLPQGILSSSAATIGNTWNAVSADLVAGAMHLEEETRVDYRSELLNLDFAQEYTASDGQRPFTLKIKGRGDLKNLSLRFNPAVQLDVVIRKKVPIVMVRMDTRMKLAGEIDLEVDASVVSGNVNGRVGTDQLTALSAQQLSFIRAKIFGDPAMKITSGFKRTLAVSRPQVTMVQNGNTRFAITTTTQIDLECAFEVKSSFQSRMSFEDDVRVTFGVLTGGKVSEQDVVLPVVQGPATGRIELRRPGAAVITCSTIPRVSITAANGATFWVGVRDSFVAEAEYVERCADSPQSEATNTVTLRSEYGVQVGARKYVAPQPWTRGTQAAAPNDILGPYEVWTRSHEITSESRVLKGIAMCTPACSDGVKSDGETDADCGGLCGTCDLGRACTRTTDCSFGYCASGRCTTNSCFDHVTDGNESDVDCGGQCAPCDEKKRCVTGADCVSGACQLEGTGVRAFGVCVLDHCADLVRDADEGGVDCGGKDCKKCPTGGVCGARAHCESAYCDGERCVASKCNDREWSPGETDVDCGGTCKPCHVTQRCSVGADCTTGFCDPLRSVCSTPTCANGVKEPSEVGIDCGEGCARGCSSGSLCSSDHHCESRDCENNFCAGTTCVDGVRNGSEPEVDCGGTCARKCGIGEGCVVNDDCWTKQCNTVAHVCVTTSCENGIVDQAFESDVDCGGFGPCDRCANGKSCTEDSDCASELCSTKTSTCVATQCTDGVKNRDETDIDCGGSCAKCAVTKTCTTAGDCASGICNGVNHTCVSTTCEDGVLTANESDIDCGGVCATKCTQGDHCNGGPDCANNECDPTLLVCL